jgi:hypothetical protein
MAPLANEIDGGGPSDFKQFSRARGQRRRRKVEVSELRAPEQSVPDYAADEVQLLTCNAKVADQRLGDVSLRWSKAVQYVTAHDREVNDGQASQKTRSVIAHQSTWLGVEHHASESAARVAGGA